MSEAKDKITTPTSYRRAFWAAVIVTLLLWIIPFGGLVIYPFSVLATWAHEMGHGVTALIVGGGFHKLELYASLGGVATTSTSGPLAGALVSFGGLIGAPFLGALIIAIGPRPKFVQAIIVTLSALLVISVALWVQNAFGVIACITIAIGLGLGAWRLSPRRRFIAVQLIGIQLALSALRNWEYLFMANAKVGWKVIPSDVSAISKALGAPNFVWGVLITAINLGLLYGAYRLAKRRVNREKAAAPA